MGKAVQTTDVSKRMVIVMPRPTTHGANPAEAEVLEFVDRRLKACPFGFIFRKVSAQYDDGRLTLRGSVPSFYLKQVLQELLRHVEGVRSICNDVDVVCSNGVSSARPNKPR